MAIWGLASLIALSLAALEKDDWRLDEDTYMAQSNTLTHVVIASSYCAGKNIHPALHFSAAVKDAQCFAKCGPGGPCEGSFVGSCASCNGYIRAYDMEDSDALCLPKAECSTLCDGLRECYGIETAVDQAKHQRCYLNTFACLEDVTVSSLAADPNYEFSYKQTVISEACPLGYGARVFTAPGAPPGADAYGVAGIYDRTIGPDGIPVYLRVDGTDRVVFHESGCGWAVEKADTRRLEALAEAAAGRETCEDDVTALTAAFGSEAEEFCSHAGWTDYCSYPLFAALCARTCNVECSGDAEEAAEALAPLVGAVVAKEKAACDALAPLCAQPVVAAACRATCAAAASPPSPDGATARRGRGRSSGTAPRRGDAKPLPASFALDFRLALARRDRSSRRLGLTADGFYEVYYTFRPALPVAAECSTTHSDVSLTAPLYDVFKLHSDTEQVWSYSCDAVMVWKTMSGMYCPHNNIKTYGPNADAAITAERCVEKCGPGGAPKPGVDPAGAYCDGWDATFNPTSNALCLPRAKCEELCASTMGCIGFDMHLLTNRCWLNTAYCMPGANPSLEASGGSYEMSDEFDFVYRAFGKTEYTTVLPGLKCAETDSPELFVDGLTNYCGNRCDGPKGTIVSVLANSPRNATHPLVPAPVASSVKAAFLPVDKIVQVSLGEVAVGVVDPMLKSATFGAPAAFPAAMGNVKAVEVVASPGGFTIYAFEPGVLAATDFVKYYTYAGALSVAGTVGPMTTTGTTQTFAYSLTGVDPACASGAGTAGNSCGIHIHSGTTCAGNALGHYYTGSVTSDPWTTIAYTSSGSATSGMLSVDTGDTDVSGRSMIIHAYDGSRIACAILTSSEVGLMSVTGTYNEYTLGVSFGTVEMLPLPTAVVVDDLLDAVVTPKGLVVLAIQTADGAAGVLLADTPSVVPLSTGTAAQVEATENLVVYAVSGAELTLHYHAMSGPVKSVNVAALAGCALYQGLAAVTEDVVLVTCADMSAVLCDLALDTCGTATSDWSGGAGMAGSESDLGYDVVCPKKTTCFARTVMDHFSILTVSATDLSITEVNIVSNFTNPAANSSMIALMPGELYIARTAMYATGLTRTEADYIDYENASIPFDFTVTDGVAMGVLFSELGTTWSPPPPGACTYTGPFTGTEVCGGRGACEAACAEAGSACGAFAYMAGSAMCKLYPACTPVASLAPVTSVNVIKSETHYCTVAIENSTVDPEIASRCLYGGAACDLSKVYHEKAEFRSQMEFRTKDNISRIVFDTSRGCSGWMLEQNREAFVKIPVVTFLNAPIGLFAEYQTAFLVDFTNMTAANLPYCTDLLTPPADAYPRWSCTHNPVVNALCRATCMALTKASVADEIMEFHQLVEHTADHAAAAEYTGGADCAATKKKDCDALLAFLCPKKCGDKTGPQPTSVIEKDYLLGDDSATWDTLFATFANGSQYVHTFGDSDVPLKPFGYTQCKTIAPAGQRSLLATDKVYRAVVSLDSSLSMKSVCASETLCPSLTTCVEAEHMFNLELGKLRSPPFSTKVAALADPGAVMHSTAWLDGMTPRDFTDPDFDYKFPKVLVSENRAEAVIRTSLWEFGKEIFRAAPGSTRVRLHLFPPSTVSAIASLSSVEDEWAVANFGTKYALPAGYSGWLTDIFRLELFAAEGAPVVGDAPMMFEVFIPGAAQPIFVFANGVVCDDCTIVPSTVGSSTLGWYTVTVPGPKASSDFLFSTDLDECALGWETTGCEATDDGGKCVNDLPAAGGYHCECLPGYKGENGELPLTKLAVGVQCVLAQYVAPSQHFLVYHNDAAEYGLHVGEIRLFEASGADGECLGVCPNKKLGTDCHYGFEVGDRADTAHLNIRSLKVSGEYPGHPKGGLKDNGGTCPTCPAGAEWWPDKLSLDRMAGTGAWISFEVPAAVEVNCVRLELSCGKGMPKQFQLHRGKAGAVVESAAFGYAGETFTPGGEPGFTETVISVAKDGKVDLAVPCGILNAQYFGEEFVNYVDVETPCECKQLCVDHIDEGCATWKWYDETKHCFLQRDTFVGADEDSEVLPDGAGGTMRASFRSMYEKGTGWWKRSFAEGWPGWVTGTTGPLAIGVKTTPATPVVGAPFSLRLYGAGFPYDEESGEDLGARQRIKIVPADKSCVLDMPPDYVEGIDCTNWFTCSPKPDTYSRTSATWSGLTITAQKADSSYKVCWCAGKCWMLTNWVEVPGEIEVTASGYSWAFETPGLVTKVAARAGVSVRVSRPAFSSLAPVGGWKVKLVRDVFDCETLGDAEICSGGLCPQSSDFGPDEALFVITTAATVVAGDYSICLSDDGVKFFPIPSATTRYFTIVSQPTDLDHPKGPFHHQKISARAGKSASVVLKGFGLSLPNAQSVALVDADDCFLNAGNSFNDSGIVAILTGATSTKEEYKFTGDVPAKLKGKYTLCMCDDESWATNRYESRPDSWTGASYYYAADSLLTDYDFTELPATDKGYSVALSMYDGFNASVPASAASDLCVSKCSAGCVGPTCFCDGLLADDEATFGTTNGPLCLDAPSCRELCEATTGCSGYAMSKGLNRCFLSTGGDKQYTPDYDLFTKKATAPCRTVADFMVMKGTKTWMKEAEVKKNVGDIFVTQKADLGVDFVVSPDETVSIEITGDKLSFTGDRIMVIDCYGTCGIAKPTEHALIAQPVPANAFVDRPALPGAPLDMAVPKDPVPPYAVIKGKYCAENLKAKPDTNQDGHRCFKKCFEDAPCEGDSCYCGGFIPGYDTKDSDAICLPAQQCEWLCELTPGCHSVDVHKSKSRCFLNTDSCDVDEAVPATDYNLLIKAPTDTNTRRLLEKPELGRKLSVAQVRELLAAKDPGISWEKVLRYREVKVTSAGKYKLCFCDSDLLGGGICRTPADYPIEIGTLHATGLQCLLSNPKMTRGTCVSQYFGGLRCYDETVPDITVPTQYLGIPDPSGQEWDKLTKMMMDFCQYASAEDAAVFPFCEQYRLPDPPPAFPTATP